LTKRFLKEIAHLAKNDAFEPQLAGKRWHPDDFTSPDASADDASEAGNHSAADNQSPAGNPSAAGNASKANGRAATGKGDDEPRKAAAEI
jgi:hypothetical protein